ncbi:chromosome partitioning protein ParA [Asticcacaulis sp. AC460]|nr:chromosome partitioning protein ParA [Asticcacaulis sp. AC460]
MSEQDEKTMRVLAIANQKGGVGKTTTAINLGTALAAIGMRVLLVDLDPQGNASTGLGVPKVDRESSLYDVIVDQRPIGEAAVKTSVPGLSLLPSDPDLSGVEIELGHAERRSYRLRDALQGLGDKPVYDYVLIDCPPSLNLLTVNAMSAADAVLVPLQCEFFALEGLSQLMRTIDLVRGSLNPRLNLQGIVLTMFDKRNALSGHVEKDVRQHFGHLVYDTVIPRNVRVSEAPSFGKPALIYDVRCSGSQAYIKLAKELVTREKTRKPQAA